MEQIPMDKKELLILSQFRRNARENLTTASRRIHVPISTIYDKLKRYMSTVIKKHTTLLDFTQLGYGLKMHTVIKVTPSEKSRIESYLNSHPRVNSLYTISNGYDFLAEVILKDMQEVKAFLRELDKYNVTDHHEFFIVDDLRREDFLTDSDAVDIPLSS